MDKRIQHYCCKQYLHLWLGCLFAFSFGSDLLASTSQQKVFTEVHIQSETTFQTGKADFKAAAPFALDEVIERLDSYQNVEQINIVGHSCDGVPGISETEISERRARAVAYYFRTHGVDSIPINVVAPDELYIKYASNGESPAFNQSRVEI